MRTFDPDDPMLTAYALGELEGDELREIEELLARDPEAARHVDSVRAAAAGLGEAFEREAAPAVEPIRAIEVEPARPRRSIPFLYYVSTAVAACFFVVLAVRLVNPVSDEHESAKAMEMPVPAVGSRTTSAPTAKEMAAMRNEADELRQRADKAFVESASSESLSAQMAARQRADDKDVAQAKREAPAEDLLSPVVADSSAPLKDKVVSAEPAAASDRAAVEVAGAPQPPAAAGELKAQKENEPVTDLNAVGAADGDEIRLKPFSVVVTGPDIYRTVESLQRALDARRKISRIDVPVLLADLGYAGTARAGPAGRDIGAVDLSQTTSQDSPEHDPEAALVRAVERFAELLALNTRSNDESWDRVLADARYAAGDNAKRQEFVKVIEAARGMAHAADNH